MENATVEINPGEIKVKFEQPVGGKFTLGDLGVSREALEIAGGNLRIVFELGQLGDYHFFRMPTLEVAYREKAHESAWVAEFNGENIVEKIDHSGHATVLLLKRDRLDEQRHRHENNLILHGDFSEVVHLDPEKSYFNILETKGS